MSFEFELVRPDATSGFSPEDRAQLRAWWDRYPTAVAPDGSLLVFPDENVRAIRLERRRREPTRNDYLTPHVHVGEDRVLLSVVGDPVTDGWFYEFALWCQRHWQCELQYFGEPVPATDILAASGD